MTLTRANHLAAIALIVLRSRYGTPWHNLPHARLLMSDHVIEAAPLIAATLEEQADAIDELCERFMLEGGI
jgi:hypothetical protein